jgi:hypothetical protein
VWGEALASDPARFAEARQAFTVAADAFRDRGYDWGVALCDLSLGEVEVRAGAPRAPERLRRALRYWTRENVPALQARTLVALADAAERTGGTDPRRFLRRAHRLYSDLSMPAAERVAARLNAPARSGRPHHDPAASDLQITDDKLICRDPVKGPPPAPGQR